MGCKIRTKDFEDAIMKALKMQRFAVKDKNLRCKHYKYEYNIIRNELIGIRHILAIIIYTDMSRFCRAYRATYRKMVKHAKDGIAESEQSVTERHQALYFYSRALFEAIEFFGESMPSNMKVFHGLSEEMKFVRFTAYFNQPISTTPSYNTATKFANGNGIILEFKRGGSNPTLIPKYLDVSWLSNFPDEDERLFYGDNIMFEINDIVQTHGKIQRHKQELRILNMFQNMVRNQKILWIKKNEEEAKKLRDDIEDLVVLINCKTNYDDIKYIMPKVTGQSELNRRRNEPLDAMQEAKSESAEEKEVEMIQIRLPNNQMDRPRLSRPKTAAQQRERISEYGQALFDHFCNNELTHWICINNYELIPSALKIALLMEKKDNVYNISFVKLLKLFECLETVTLNELNIKQLMKQSMFYMNAVTEYIEATKNNEFKSELKEIVFESKPEIDGKRNSILSKLATKYQQKFEKLRVQWSIGYDFRLKTFHTLTFRNTK